MALIYKITFPQSVFSAATFSGDPADAEFLNTFGNNNEQISTTFRNYTFPKGDIADRNTIILPKEDIASTDLKVKTQLEEVKSKITYDISFVGQTAKTIAEYIKFIRLPLGTNAYPEPAPGLEYLFNLDKQIKIRVEDDCCPVIIEGRGQNKIVIEGFIPLNTVRYCDNTECTVNCTIYEDGNRVNAIKCIESTVLGLRSNIGILQNAEVHGDIKYRDQTGVDTTTRLANQNAKWFDVCIEPQSPGLATLLLNIIGIVKLILIFFVFGLIPLIGTILITLTIVVNIINIIIRVINTLGGNISLIDSPLLQPLNFATDLIDEIFGLERIVEGLYGCRYIRGGYRVASIVSSVCSICEFSRNKIKDAYIDFAFNNDGVEDIKIPVTSNPFIPNGDLSTELREDSTLETFNTAYVPAEEAYNRRKGDNITAGSGENPNNLKDVAIRASSIETTDKILTRLGSLWGTGWDVVNVPVTPDTPNGIQLQLGSIEGKYAFSNVIENGNEVSPFVDIPEATICYTVSEGNRIGYSTTWTQDSSDNAGNKHLRNYNGYVSYYFTELKNRKPKDVKDFGVDFSPTHYIGSLKDDSIYDDYNAGRVSIIGITSFGDYFDDGQMINSTEFTSVPKLVGFKVGGTSVLSYRKAARVKDHNQYFTGSYRMSDTVDSTVGMVVQGNITLDSTHSDYNRTGIQSQIPYFTVGYFGEGKLIPGTYTDTELDLLIQDYLDKYGSSEVSYQDARSRVRNQSPSFLGPFNNIPDTVTIPIDGLGYNFAPLMEFSFELENYSCGQEDLLSQCVTEAMLKVENPGLDEGGNPAYKLRLIKLRLGLGVVTELEIDYENRDITASGYVIPFVQNGIDYSNR